MRSIRLFLNPAFVESRRFIFIDSPSLVLSPQMEVGGAVEVTASMGMSGMKLTADLPSAAKISSLGMTLTVYDVGTGGGGGGPSLGEPFDLPRWRWHNGDCHFVLLLSFTTTNTPSAGKNKKSDAAL